MATLSPSNYREEIEALKEEQEFEALGDARYLEHEDDDARLLWAFHRPSGSHPKQVADKNVEVAIMAFNHSRLGAYERFTTLNLEVIKEDALRNKIRNRSRMLFRAMVDDDFKELVAVLKLYPAFLPLACDQMINGRIWNETYADLVAASTFLSFVEADLDEKLLIGVKRRLPPLKNMSFDEAKALLKTLQTLARELHKLVVEHYVSEFERWMNKEAFHPLQSVVIKKALKELGDEKHRKDDPQSDLRS